MARYLVPIDEVSFDDELHWALSLFDIMMHVHFRPRKPASENLSLHFHCTFPYAQF